MTSPTIVWFRDDHRLGDNPALSAAIASGAPLLCLFILDEESDGIRPLGGAARWWLHGSLEALASSLKNLGATLRIFRGPAFETLKRIVMEAEPAGVYWNRRYAEAEIDVDRKIKTWLTDKGITTQSCNGRLLHEPWTLRTKSDKPFQVFTPYLRAALAKGDIETPLPAPRALKAGSWPKSLADKSLSLEELALLPKKPNWARGFTPLWTPGEHGARKAMSHFLSHGLKDYATQRGNPGIQSSSRLSPHLRFGEISPRQIWHAVANATHSHPAEAPHKDAEKFASEVIWRDFAYAFLMHNPDLPTKPFDRRFEHFAWEQDKKGLRAWQMGQTGYPFVDAGMRELWQTGWMHNRVRMVTASFLIKHLLVHWRRGEEWFWDTLVDADEANNPFNWQWVAGSGADASPFFRIFNPIKQGQTFDPQGDYVRRYVPELAGLPDAYLHEPWSAPPAVLIKAGICLGETYPHPIVDHSAARKRALEAFASLPSKTDD